MDQSVSVDRGELVGVVDGSGLDQGVDERGLSRECEPRDDDRSPFDRHHTGVNEDVLGRQQRDLGADLGAQHPEREIFVVGGGGIGVPSTRTRSVP